MHPVAETWQSALSRLDDWFRSAHARHPGVIPCRAGCSACCHGPFDISAADALLLQEGLATLPEAVRLAVRARSEALFTRMRQLAPAWRAPWDLAQLGEEHFDAMIESLAEEPCPLLDEAGRCVAYLFRPLVCRLIGLPMMTAGGLELENACPIQDRFPSFAALDPELFDLEALEAEETACQEGAAAVLFDSPLHRDFETTIAACFASSSPPSSPSQP
jgi:Fe-S-cluster containining protein